MNNQEYELDRAGDNAASANSGAEQKVATKARRAKSGQKAVARNARDTKNKGRSSQAKPGGKSKKDQLIALVSKPNGARISVLVDRLGWQAHTVRAALSGLRKQGVEIATSKSAKTGEAVYTIVTRSDVDVAAAGEAAA